MKFVPDDDLKVKKRGHRHHSHKISSYAISEMMTNLKLYSIFIAIGIVLSLFMFNGLDKLSAMLDSKGSFMQGLESQMRERVKEELKKQKELHQAELKNNG